LILAFLFLVAGIGLFFIPWKPVRTDGSRYPTYEKDKRLGFLGLGLFAFFMLLACIRVVDAGHVGIPVTFGNVGGQLNAGVTFTNPFASVNELSVRTEDYTANPDENADDLPLGVQGSDGATGNINATVLYRLTEDQASNVFRQLGVNYEERIIAPLTRTCVREAFVTETMVDASTNGRERISALINTCLTEGLEPRGITLESFQLQTIAVSEQVQQAIDAKVAAEQAAERAVFDLQRAAAEAEIQRVQALGTADSESIIACGATREIDPDTGEEIVRPKEGEACENNLTPEYLTLQYIQAMEALANSDNNSTVILPADQSLIPLLPVGEG
jgi:regulator of protease activity HflC (stomatin/prohibitin superfamily)